MRIYQFAHTVALGDLREDPSDQMVHYRFYADRPCIYPTGYQSHCFAGGGGRNYDPATGTYGRTWALLYVYDLTDAPGLLTQPWQPLGDETAPAEAVFDANRKAREDKGNLSLGTAWSYVDVDEDFIDQLRVTYYQRRRTRDALIAVACLAAIAVAVLLWRQFH